MIKSLIFAFFCLVHLAVEAQDRTPHYIYKQREIGKVNEQGLKTGEWKIYDSNDKVTIIETYENGNWVGLRQIFYNDKVVSTEELIHRKKKYFLLVKEYYENGQLMSVGFKKRVALNFISGNNEETTGKYANTGKWRYYYDNGKLKNIGEYSSDGRSGKWKSYHNNGHLAEKGKYNNIGECIGKWKFYDLNGKLIESYSYDDN
jgi:antitoxin component YwqK of YwqJK toxin-antitoxin module